MKKILITGANGFLGYNLVHYLYHHINCDIIAADINCSQLSNFNITKITTDILQLDPNDNLFAFFGKPDVLIHLAWQDGFNHHADSHINNLPKHYHFLTNLIKNGCKSVSVMGSMHEIGCYEGAVNAQTPCFPLSNYGIAKNALKQMLLTFCDGKDISFKWLRGYYITGDEQHNHSIFSKILNLAAQGQKTFPFTTGENKYDFLDIHDVIQQIAAASLQTQTNGIIEICSGQPISLKEKVEDFITQKHLDIQPEYGAFPCRKYDSPAIWGDNSRIQTIMSQRGIL